MKTHHHRVFLSSFVLFAGLCWSGTHSRAALFDAENVVCAQAAGQITGNATQQGTQPCPGAPIYNVPRLLPTVDRPGQFLSSDFNGDGLDDLVFLSSFSPGNRLMLSLGRAGGVFAAPVSIASQ